MKPKCFDVFLNFENKSRTFPFNLKTLKQNQTFWCVPEFFITVFPTGTFLTSATLLRARLQFTFSGTSLGPLTASKTSQGLYQHSHGLQALSRPLQSTGTLLACKGQFIETFSRLWEYCRDRESVVRSQPLWAPLWPLWALSWPL